MVGEGRSFIRLHKTLDATLHNCSAVPAKALAKAVARTLVPARALAKALVRAVAKALSKASAVPKGPYKELKGLIRPLMSL